MTSEPIRLPQPADGTPMVCKCGAEFTWPQDCPGCGMSIEYRRFTALLTMMLDTPKTPCSAPQQQDHDDDDQDEQHHADTDDHVRFLPERCSRP